MASKRPAKRKGPSDEDVLGTIGTVGGFMAGGPIGGAIGGFVGRTIASSSSDDEPRGLQARAEASRRAKQAKRR